MKLVIDIPDGWYRLIMDNRVEDARITAYMVLHMIKEGTPLQKGHGRIIDESKIRSATVHYEEEKVNGYIIANSYIHETDAPTIIEADGINRRKEYMTTNETIQVIRENCYQASFTNPDRARIINAALDKAIEALKRETEEID